MEALLIIIILAFPVAGLAGFIGGLVALRQVRRLRATMNQWENRLSDLEAGTPTAPSTSAPAAQESPTVPDPAPEPAVADDRVRPSHPAISPPAPRTAPTDETTPPPTFEPPPRPTPPPQSPSVPRPRINWEQWIGVRGAAAAGGIVLALAALLFFQYSIEHGLISPAMRVALGALAGVVCIVGSEWLVKRRQAPAAHALAGAGFVILYGATWAAQNLYDLIGWFPAFVLMVVITVGCVVLATARRARFIAILGLLGGFATPLLVASDPTGPAALFGYILLLDLGLLWVARARGWPLLAVLSLLGTALHQSLWIIETMDADRALLGLAVLAVFGLAFLFANNGDNEHSGLWRATRAGGVAVPFAFGLHFASNARLADNPIPLGLLLVVLSAGACWLARRESRWAAPGAAGGSLGVMALWFVTRTVTPTLAWQAVLVCVAIAAVFFAFALVNRATDRARTFGAAALVAEGGFLAMLSLAPIAPRVHQPWPWLAGSILLAAALVIHAPRRGWLHLPAALAPAFGLIVFCFGHGDGVEAPGPTIIATVIIGLAVVFQAVAFKAPSGSVRRWAERSAASGSLLLMVIPAVQTALDDSQVLLWLGTALALGLLAALAATRMRSGPWYLAAVLSTALWQSLMALSIHFNRPEVDPALPALAVLSLSSLFFALWPVVTSRAFASSRAAWWGGALAGPVWFPILREGVEGCFGPEYIGLLPIALALVALGALLRLRSILTADARFRAMVWFGAVALSFVAIAIPLQLEREWITIGWALNGLAVLALWKRLDHPGLKYFSLALLGAAVVRLIVNPEVLHYYPRSSMPVLNWVSRTYLVPAAAMVMSMRLLKPLEIDRLRDWEARFVPGRRALGAAACGLGAIATVFVWLNLCIADLFGSGTHIELSLRRLPARDATTSIAWALYALVLLAIGVRGRNSSLRWLSLGLMITTIFKVFLHDLGELEDLYRVASLVGLAISLIIVSLIYRQYVFKSDGDFE